MFNPFKKHFTSGIPDPAAKGSIYTNIHAIATNRQLQDIKNKKATPYMSSPVFSFSIRLWNTLNLKFERAFVKYATNRATTPHINPKNKKIRMKTMNTCG